MFTFKMEISHNSQHRAVRADLFGMTNSLLCLAHCMAMPVLVAAGAGFLSHPLIELLFIAVSAWAVRSAVASGTPRQLALYLWLMWAVFAAMLVAEHFTHSLHWLGWAASAGLVVGHSVNYRYRSVRAPQGNTL